MIRHPCPITINLGAYCIAIPYIDSKQLSLAPNRHYYEVSDDTNVRYRDEK